MGNIHLIDRCWCDLTPSNFFQPFDVTRWESMSLEREKSARTGFRKDRVPEADVQEVAPGSDVHENAEGLSGPAYNASGRTQGVIDSIGSWWGIWDRRQQRVEDERVIGEVEETRISSPTPEPTPHPLPLLRRQYDLRPYGVGLILDFGWGRSP